MNANTEKNRTQKKLDEIHEIQTFSENFTALREAKKLTKKQMAELLSVSPTTVSAYEAGEKSPSLTTAATIARRCNVSLDWLCGISLDKVNREEVNYREIIECLIKLSELTEIDVDSILVSESIIHNDGYIEPTEREAGEVLVYDSVVVNFIKEWKKVRQLYDDNTIDSSLYDPWIAKKISDYDCLVMDWENRDR